MRFGQSLKNLSNLVVLPHSVFALPFALVAYQLALRQGALRNAELGNVKALLLIILAAVSARTAAMAFNRLSDADIDALNPRTSNRELPAGRVSKAQAWGLLFFTSALFLSVSYLLGWHCLLLAPFVLALLFFYSYCKRLGSYAHFVLGLSLALAPGGAWWVLRPVVELIPCLLMSGVLLWVSGFDLLYSCQDVQFDREHSVFSIPAEIGVERALVLARWLHVLSFFFFLFLGFAASLSLNYFIGLLVLSLILLAQHFLVSAQDLSRLTQAFFTVNGLFSVAFMILVFLS